MTNNLNQSLYKRFGVELGKEEVEEGFRAYVKMVFEEDLAPLRYPGNYEDSRTFSSAQREVLQEACRQMFLNFEKFQDWNYGFGWFVDFLFERESSKFLLRFQILLDLIYKNGKFNHELEIFIKKISNYLLDFPIIGLSVRTYKTKSPQLLPSMSKIFEKEVNNTLDLLDVSTEYLEVVKHFENGLKEFLFANTEGQLKDAVEDMYTSCDEVVQIFHSKKNIGFRNIFVGPNTIGVGLNSWQTKIFDNLRNWMDKIKHGVEKGYTREDVEQIILFVSSFIRTVVNNKKKTKEVNKDAKKETIKSANP